MMLPDVMIVCEDALTMLNSSQSSGIWTAPVYDLRQRWSTPYLWMKRAGKWTKDF